MTRQGTLLATEAVAPTPKASIDDEDGVLRVGASTSPQDLAASIAHACYDGKPPVIRAIGAGAVNQAIKACAIARQYVAPRAMDLSIRPGFTTVQMREGDVSAIVLKVLIN